MRTLRKFRLVIEMTAPSDNSEQSYCNAVKDLLREALPWYLRNRQLYKTPLSISVNFKEVKSYDRVRTAEKRAERAATEDPQLQLAAERLFKAVEAFSAAQTLQALKARKKAS